MLFGSADFDDQAMRYGGANKHTGKHKRTKQIYTPNEGKGTLEAFARERRIPIYFVELFPYCYFVLSLVLLKLLFWSLHIYHINVRLATLFHHSRYEFPNYL